VTDDELAMSDCVLFVLPTRGDVDLFCAALRPRWVGWSAQDEDVWLVTAELRPDQGDLAELLREAQAVIADLALPTIVFCLDDRVYCLDAKARDDAAVTRSR
jgi:hypothetical protein